MFHRLEFSIEIDADKSKIWKALWNDSGYRNWTSVFGEGSHAVTDNWKEGSKVHFLGPDKNGIYSVIERHVPNELMSFKHIGAVKNGEEQPVDEETKKWTGASEIYKLNQKISSNLLTVEIDVMNQHLEFMKDAFPKALEKVKSTADD